MNWFTGEKRTVPKEQGPVLYKYGKEQMEADHFVQEVKELQLSTNRYGILNWLSKYQNTYPKIHGPNRSVAVSTILRTFKSKGYDIETRKPPDERFGNQQDRSDRLILLALQSIKETGNVPPNFSDEYRKLVADFQNESE